MAIVILLRSTQLFFSMFFILPSCVTILSVQQVTRTIVSSSKHIEGENHHYIKFKCVVGNKHHYVKLFLLLLSLSPCQLQNVLQNVLKISVSSSQLGFLTLSLRFYYKKASNAIFFVFVQLCFTISIFSRSLFLSLYFIRSRFVFFLCFYLSILSPSSQFFSISLSLLISLFSIGFNVDVHIYHHRKLAL